MKVNMLEAKNQLSRLVKAAVEGEDVIIARSGKPLVRLVSVEPPRSVGGWGRLRRYSKNVDRAFGSAVDARVARELVKD